MATNTLKRLGDYMPRLTLKGKRERNIPIVNSLLSITKPCCVKESLHCRAISLNLLEKNRLR